jgi:hypothetical protein
MKNTIYGTLILSILILIIVLIFYTNTPIIQYLILIASILLSITHCYYSYDDNKITIKDAIKKHYELYLKPLQDKLNYKIKNKTLKTEVIEINSVDNSHETNKTNDTNDANDDSKIGTGLFSFNKYKVVISQDGINTNDIIENTKKGINLLIEKSKNKKNDNSSKFVKTFCSGIFSYANTLMGLSIGVSDSITENLGNDNKEVKKISSDLNVTDLIILSQSKIFAPIRTFNIELVQKNDKTHSFNLFSLDQDINKSNFPQNMVNLKTINTTNLNDNKMYLEVLTTNSLSNLNNIIDVKWVNEMNDYISNLSKHDIFTVFAYTYKGDVIANAYLRNNKIIDDDLSEQIKFLTTSEMAWSDAYFPYFFQMLNIIKTKDFDLLKQNLNEKQTFRNIIDIFQRFSNKSNIKSNPDCIEAIIIADEILNKNKNDLLNIIKYIKQNNITSVNYLLLFALSFYECFNKSFWKLVIDEFATDLDRIIHKSPPLNNYLITYRGSSRNYIKNSKDKYKIKRQFLDKNYTKEGYLFNDVGFISTTIDIQKTLQFTHGIDKCCLQRIILVPGTKCLPIYGISYFGIDEKEILLPSSSIFFVSNYSDKMPLYLSGISNNYDNITNVCEIEKLKVETTDLVIIAN